MLHPVYPVLTVNTSQVQLNIIRNFSPLHVQYPNNTTIVCTQEVMHYIVSSTPTNLQSFKNVSLDKSYLVYSLQHSITVHWHSFVVSQDGENCKTRVRPASFKIEIPGSVEFRENFMQKVHKVREALVLKLQKPVNNADIFEAALDSWIAPLPEQDGGGTAPQVCTSAALTERLTNQ